MKRLGFAVALYAALICTAYAQVGMSSMFPGPGTPHSSGATNVFTKTQSATTGAAFGPAGTIAATFPSLTAGNFVWGAIRFSAGSGQTITSVIDDATVPNTYNVGTAVCAAGECTALYWRGNCGGKGTTVTITVTFSANAGNLIILGELWSGVTAATDPKDAAPVGNSQVSPGTATDGITSTNVTAVTNGDLILGATINMTNTTLATAGTGFTSGTTYNAAIAAINLESTFQSSAAAISATFTQGTNNAAITHVLPVKQ